MKCETVREKLYDLFFDLLSKEEREEIEQHLASCAECKKALEQAGREVKLLEHWQDAEPPDGLVAETMTAVHSGKAGQEEEPVQYVPVEPALAWLGSRRFWQVAAGLVAVLLVGTAARMTRVVTRKAEPAEISVYGPAKLSPGDGG